MKRFIVCWLLMLISPVLFAGKSLPTQAELDARLVGSHVSLFSKPMTRLEVALMDPACRAIGMGYVNGVFWSQAMRQNGEIRLLDLPQYAMAKNNHSFHHYCWGKLGRLRYFSATNPKDKQHAFMRWVGGMTFTVDWETNPSHHQHWPYLYVAYEELADAYFYHKQYRKSITKGEKALKENPESGRAYARIADDYVAIGDKEQALKQVSEGLRHIPNSKALQRRYKQLGGKLPYPVPYAKAPKQTASQRASEEKRSDVKPIADSEGPGSNSMDQDKKPDSATDTSSKSGDNIANPTTQAKPYKQPIGTPSNPYCRFCP